MLLAIFIILESSTATSSSSSKKNDETGKEIRIENKIAGSDSATLPLITSTQIYYTMNGSYNGTNNETAPGVPFSTPTYVFVWVSVAFVVVFVVGVVGNLLVILVVGAVREMRTPTNVFLMHLSIADLLVLVICQPSAFIDLYAEEVWMLGHFMCELAFTWIFFVISFIIYPSH